ncbi:carbon monoxide dehydrogenase subunit G [Fulvimarina sp. 2208YS6-2-32]|uniref:Carbon monoxide dehydrogenase subunit G n=1 Tax=Fulvimarina uroteuthidis TaxID=3098149 RepID=A0ABU5HYB3_9HYPH|nr:carbon monoxide dehydrogenase subunit G [Fulvimarina sp. 2208YS6-2-32]MDY8108118.1 carbon monoxide dehydrogenase subunit G [Fulvimarina sp. 2208YS6-2-32]
MELKGEYRLPASRETVWKELNDPDTLRDCIPGCESLEKNDDDTMNATVKIKIGPMKVAFKGEVRLENINAPESYSIVGEGKGGIAGFAKGKADVHLAEAGPDETILTYEVDAQVGGKMAQLGGRLIESTAKKLSAEFFDCFARKVSDGNATAEGETVTA